MRHNLICWAGTYWLAPAVRLPPHYCLLSSFDRAAAVPTALITAPLMPAASSTLMPAMVVPAGEATLSLSTPAQRGRQAGRYVSGTVATVQLWSDLAREGLGRDWAES